MAELSDEIAAFERHRSKLETDHTGKWVLVHDEEVQGLFGSSEEAAQEATSRFGRGPYLIRQIGAPPIILPASVMFQPLYSCA